MKYLKELIRAGKGKLSAKKIIKNGILVNAATEEMYPTDVAIGEVDSYEAVRTEAIDYV